MESITRLFSEDLYDFKEIEFDHPTFIHRIYVESDVKINAICTIISKHIPVNGVVEVNRNFPNRDGFIMPLKLIADDKMTYWKVTVSFSRFGTAPIDYNKAIKVDRVIPDNKFSSHVLPSECSDENAKLIEAITIIENHMVEDVFKNCILPKMAHQAPVMPKGEWRRLIQTKIITGNGRAPASISACEVVAAVAWPVNPKERITSFRVGKHNSIPWKVALPQEVVCNIEIPVSAHIVNLGCHNLEFVDPHVRGLKAPVINIGGTDKKYHVVIFSV